MSTNINHSAALIQRHEFIYAYTLTDNRNLNILCRDSVGSVRDRRAGHLQSRRAKIYPHKLGEKREKEHDEIDAEDPLRSRAHSMI